MEHHRRIALIALHHISAFAATDERGKPPPVKKDKRLPVLRHVLAQDVLHDVGYDLYAGPCLKFHSHIDKFYPGQLLLLYPLRKFNEAVLARHGLVVRFQGRCRAAEYHGDAGPPCPFNGNVTGVVPRHVFLLVTRFMLFVHNKYARVLEGAEHR